MAGDKSGGKAFSVFRGTKEIVVWEQAGSPKFTWGQGAQTLTATYKVAYDDLFDALIALLGTTEAASIMLPDTTQLGYYKRSLPHSYPHTATLGKLYAESASTGRGEGPRGQNDDKVAKYQWWIFDVIYRPPLFPIVPDSQLTPGDPDVPQIPDETGLARYVSYKEEQTFGELTYKAGDWTWLEGPLVGRGVAARVVLKEYRGTLTITHHNIPLNAVPRLTIARFANTVNADAIQLTQSFSYPPNSLLYQLADYDPVTLPDMTLAVNVRHHWKVNVQDDGTGGWLKWRSPETGNVPYLIGKGNVRMFNGGAHKELFRPAA